jgi:uncharacterized protein YbaR (Trm112 family)
MSEYREAKRQPTRLLPCPFCRGRYELDYLDGIDSDAQGNDISCIVCDTCGAWGPWVTGGYSSAVRFWNLRNAGLPELAAARRIKAAKIEEPGDEKPEGAKACPFCRCLDLWIENGGLKGEQVWFVVCSNCNVGGPRPEVREQNTKDEAVREWNGELIALLGHKHGDGSKER